MQAKAKHQRKRKLNTLNINRFQQVCHINNGTFYLLKHK